MDYKGSVRKVRVRINGRAEKIWSSYVGQECDGILYEGNISPQINSEQLSPPLPKYQSIKADWIDVL